MTEKLTDTFKRSCRATVAAAVVSAASVAALSALGTGAAAADEPIWVPLPVLATAATTVKKLNDAVEFAQTTANIEVDNNVDDLVDGKVPLGGTLVLPQATTQLKLGSLDLATIKLTVADPSALSGTMAANATNDGLDLVLDQSFKIKIDSIAPLGIDTGSASSGSGSASSGSGSGSLSSGSGSGSLSSGSGSGSGSGSSSGGLVGPNCETDETSVHLTGGLKATDGTDNILQTGEVDGTYTIPAFHNCGLLTPLLTALVSGPDNPLTVKLAVPLNAPSSAPARSLVSAPGGSLPTVLEQLLHR